MLDHNATHDRAVADSDAVFPAGRQTHPVMHILNKLINNSMDVL